jgi:hypothetical protein
MSGAAKAADRFSGAALYDDLKRYDSFGVHRFGTPGAAAAFDWLAERLRASGLAVEDQPFTMERQYFLESATLKVGDQTLTVLPQWWLAEDKASFDLTAPLAGPSVDATGKFARLRLAYDQGAYLSKNHREAFAAAFARNPVGVLVSIDHPSGEIFTYNVAQTDKPWPVPVILVAPKDLAVLDAAEAAGAPVAVSVRGAYGKNVAGRNVVGRLDRGKERTIVVSTPVTSWFTSSCERGPGIAAFLASADLAAKTLTEVNFVFVATGGHEIGHGGMELFIHDRAPKPASVAAWLHYGASLACYQWTRDGATWSTNHLVDSAQRFLATSASLAPTVQKHFAAIAANRLVAERAAIGELRDVHGAGYLHFFGMAGLHSFFHTALDRADKTGPEALEVVARAFAATLTEIAATPKPAPSP